MVAEGPAQKLAGVVCVTLLVVAVAYALAAPMLSAYPSFELPWPKWRGLWRGRLEATYERSLAELGASRLDVDVEVKAGSLEVQGSFNETQAYRVEVYSPASWLGPTSAVYDVEEGVVDGVAKLKVTLSGGLVKVYVNPSRLVSLSLRLAAGSAKLSLKGLNDTSMLLDVAASSLDADVAYASASKAELRLKAAVSGVDLNVEVPSEVKVYASAEASAGSVTVEVEGLGSITLSGAGSKSISDPGFTEGLKLSVEASASSVDARVER